MQNQNGFNERGEPELAAIALGLFVLALAMVAAKSVGVEIGHHMGWIKSLPHEFIAELIGHPL